MNCLKKNKGFSLVEVVLAIGVISIAVLVLVGLLSGTQTSVRNVIDNNIAMRLTGKINSYLENINFAKLYENVYQSEEWVLVAYDKGIEGDTTSEALETVLAPLEDNSDGTALETLDEEDLQKNVRGTIYRILISASSVVPIDLREETTKQDSSTPPISRKIFKLVHDKIGSSDPDANDYYDEGFLGLHIRIYQEPPPGGGRTFNKDKVPKESELIFTYDTAVQR